jgi:DNA-binding transcriptional ArsR family regulator
VQQTGEAVSQRPTFEATVGALVGHPTRLKAWAILADGVASPREIAQELRLDVSHVGYHVRKLSELDLIELVGERPVRGAVEHFYKAVARPFMSQDDLENMTPEQRESMTRSVLQLILADASRAVEAGTFDRRLNRWLVRLPLQLDDEGFDELDAIHADLYGKTLEVQENVQRRCDADPERETVPAQSATMFYELPKRSTGTDSGT